MECVMQELSVRVEVGCSAAEIRGSSMTSRVLAPGVQAITKPRRSYLHSANSSFFQPILEDVMSKCRGSKRGLSWNVHWARCNSDCNTLSQCSQKFLRNHQGFQHS